MCRGQRAPCQSRMSPSIVLALGIEPGSSSLTAKAFANWAVLLAVSVVSVAVSIFKCVHSSSYFSTVSRDWIQDPGCVSKCFSSHAWHFLLYSEKRSCPAKGCSSIWDTLVSTPESLVVNTYHSINVHTFKFKFPFKPLFKLSFMTLSRHVS